MSGAGAAAVGFSGAVFVFAATAFFVHDMATFAD